MPTALITGISGFIGKHLQRQLTSQGWQVYGFDIRPGMDNVFVGDLTDHAALSRAIAESKPEVVFHLAGAIKSNDADVYYKSNLFGTLNLFDAVMQSDIRPAMVVASSSAVYGLYKSIP